MQWKKRFIKLMIILIGVALEIKVMAPTKDEEVFADKIFLKLLEYMKGRQDLLEKEDKLLDKLEQLMAKCSPKLFWDNAEKLKKYFDDEDDDMEEGISLIDSKKRIKL